VAVHTPRRIRTPGEVIARNFRFQNANSETTWPGVRNDRVMMDQPCESSTTAQQMQGPGVGRLTVLCRRCRGASPNQAGLCDYHHTMMTAIRSCFLGVSFPDLHQLSLTVDTPTPRIGLIKLSQYPYVILDRSKNTETAINHLRGRQDHPAQKNTTVCVLDREAYSDLSRPIVLRGYRVNAYID